MGSPVQTNETSAAAAATTVAVAQGTNPTAGNVNIVWVRGPSGATVSGVADTLGNTYTARGNVTEAGTGQVLYQFTAPLTTAGSANTVTATYGASTGNRGIVVLETAGSYDASNTGTDTGNNPTTSVSATNSAQPATVYMLCNDVQGGTPGVGTGFTDGGTVWSTVGLNGRIQYKTVTTVASQSGNFANAGFDRTNTGLVIVLDAAPPSISAQPTDQTANSGATATFSVTATGGATPYTYQWQDDSGGSFANIGGATSSTYSPTASFAIQGRRYRCVVTGADSLSVTSSSAALLVAYSLSGTGPRSFPNLGHPFGAGSVESWVQGSAAAGGSHSTSGALAAQVSSLAGTAAHLTLHSTSGALATQAATISGSATHLLLHTTSGALAAQAATISGAAQHQHAATGALSAQASTLAGTAAHAVLHATSGALASQAAAISGAAEHQHATTGVLSAQAATISGAADHTTAGSSHATSGALQAGDSSLAGSATHLTLHTTTGALAAQSSTISGVAAHQRAATGSLAAQSALVSGTAAHLTLHAATGALVSQAASIAGASAKDHAAVAALVAQAASMAGAAARSAAGVHQATGALQAGDASISGDAQAPVKAGGSYDDDKPKKKRWLIKVGTQTVEVGSLQQATKLLDKLDKQVEAAETAPIEAKKATPAKVEVIERPAPQEVQAAPQIDRMLDERIAQYNAAVEAVNRLIQEIDDEEAILMLL